MKRYLLDTRVVLWALAAPRKLNAAARRILDEEPVFVSALGVWELLLKHSEGWLCLPDGSLIRAIERIPATATRTCRGRCGAGGYA